MLTFRLNKDFMLGVSTASTQIEGGDTNNTWYKWCEEGHITDSSSCITACDHWNRVEQDTKILKSLNVQTYRMSLEWSRIEPEAGKFSEDAIEHYRKEISLLLADDILPMVTLHHFSDPLWFQNIGGWSVQGNSELFVEYVKYVVEKLGDLVCEWITFNEPNVYTTFGYELGIFPPGVRNILEAAKVKSEIIKTHVNLYKIIHTIRKDKNFKGQTKVGAAIHLRIFEGITRTGKITAGVLDYVFNEQFMIGMMTGRLMFPLSQKGCGYKVGRYADFIGINYYTRNIVEFAMDPSMYFHKLVNSKDLQKTDLGWDIYPEGIYGLCRKYYNRYKLPVYITENGISDKRDNRRPDFIASHLAYIAKAIDEGVKVERYYHWTLMDNFEWIEGETANFGLYKCDFRTQERIPRESAELYSIICKEKKLDKDIIKQWKRGGAAEDSLNPS